MQKNLLMLALALVIGGSAAGASAQTVVNADVTANTTWSGTVILQRPIFVKNNATLSIAAGTIIRGQPRTAAVLAGSTVGTPGALIITQSGRINAQGTAANPIIMTTAAVDNNGDGIADDVNADGFDDAWVAGDAFLDSQPTTHPLAPLDAAGNANVSKWGGLVLEGSAPTNLADLQHPPGSPVAYGTGTVEGLTVPGFPQVDATYGGLNPNDNSGILRYVSVRHAGDEIGNGNELNGVTLAGVGTATTIDHVEVYCNFDDGFEWFGGTVNTRNLVVVFQGDDGFDMDQGHTGVHQFMFEIMAFFNNNDGTAYGSGSGDKGTEFDGDDVKTDDPAFTNNANIRLDVTQNVVDVTPWPTSNPVVYNMTIIGSTPDGANPAVSPNAANLGMQFRQGFAGTVANSIVINTGTHGGLEVDTDLGEAVPGFDAATNIANGLTAVMCSTFDDGAALGASAAQALANGDTLALALGGTAAANNVVNNALFPGLANEDTTFVPTGVAGKLDSSLKTSKIDPRPNVGLVGVAGCPAPAGPGIDSSATYRGAFDRTKPLWTDGWTALNEAGLL